MPYIDVVIHSFTTLFVIIDPLGLAPIFASLSTGSTAGSRAQLSRRATLIAAAILIAFALTGKALLKAMGITIPAFQIAGGIMLFLLAVEMLFEKRTERRHKNVEHQPEETIGAGGEDIAVFPLATPLIAGPGAIASIILLMSRYQGDYSAQALVIAMLLAVLLLTYFTFRLADPFEKLIGDTGIMVVTRLFGVILGALAVQFILSGLAQTGLIAGA
jgi:multiple antibiotic resistance protein